MLITLQWQEGDFLLLRALWGADLADSPLAGSSVLHPANGPLWEP